MIERLFVIIGAGASRGCAPPNVPRDMELLPPLVTDLFEPSGGRAGVLAGYPLANLAAADLRYRDDSLAIEQVIRERYRDSAEELDRRMFRAIPPYLQELLHRVSHGFSPFPQNYASLVTNLLRLREVVFLSLNYDVLLDNVLLAVDPQLTGMHWYVRPDRHWSLIKLHGSVNWARTTDIASPDVFTDPPEDLGLGDDILVRHFPELWKVRGFSSPQGSFRHGELAYPVLSVPVGETDELACPAAHVAVLRSKLEATQPLHLLLIGYSGNDREVLAFIRNSGKGVKTLTVVDRDQTSAQAVVTRLQEDHALEADEVTAVDGDFNQWIESGDLDRYVWMLSERQP